jgi:kynurenine formamidase
MLAVIAPLAEAAAEPVAPNGLQAGIVASGSGEATIREGAANFGNLGNFSGTGARRHTREKEAEMGETDTPLKDRRGGESRRIIDLSHTIEDGMITYRGLPAPIVCDFLTREASRAHYATGTEFHIGKIELVANTGTYVDSPFHRFADGKDLSELSLESLAELEGVVVRAVDREVRAIGREVLAVALATIDLRGKAVLVHTGWSRHWRTDQYFEGHPFLTADAANFLVETGAAIVGIDSYNIDDTGDGRRPVHTALLGADIPIVEHMTGLDKLPDAGFLFSAVPVKVKGMGTFPVRAYAVVGDRVIR